MPQKRHTVDQIIAKLRRADVELGNGLSLVKGRRFLMLARCLGFPSRRITARVRNMEVCSRRWRRN